MVSDNEWSNAICKDGALYVNRENALDIVEKIFAIKKDISKKASIISKGNKLMETYPSMKEKVDLELNYIRSLYENN